MSAERDAAREAVHAAIASHAPAHTRGEEPLLTEWTLITHWVDTEGAFWWGEMSSEGLAWPHRLGMLHGALFSPEPRTGGDDDAPPE